MALLGRYNTLSVAFSWTDLVADKSGVFIVMLPTRMYWHDVIPSPSFSTLVWLDYLLGVAF